MWKIIHFEFFRIAWSYLKTLKFQRFQFQNKELLGDNGLLPLRLYLRAIRNQHPGESNTALFSQYPTIFWWLTNPKVSRDFWLDSLALSGAGLSFWMLITGTYITFAMYPIWFVLPVAPSNLLCHYGQTLLPGRGRAHFSPKIPE